MTRSAMALPCLALAGLLAAAAAGPRLRAEGSPLRHASGLAARGAMLIPTARLRGLGILARPRTRTVAARHGVRLRPNGRRRG